MLRLVGRATEMDSVQRKAFIRNSVDMNTNRIVTGNNGVISRRRNRFGLPGTMSLPYLGKAERTSCPQP